MTDRPPVNTWPPPNPKSWIRPCVENDKSLHGSNNNVPNTLQLTTQPNRQIIHKTSISIGIETRVIKQFDEFQKPILLLTKGSWFRYQKLFS